MEMINMSQEMQRKVTRIGNSLGVTLTDALKIIDAKVGDNLNVEVVGNEIRIRKKREEVPEGLDVEFFELVEEGMKEYDEAFKMLKDR